MFSLVTEKYAAIREVGRWSMVPVRYPILVFSFARSSSVGDWTLLLDT